MGKRKEFGSINITRKQEKYRVNLPKRHETRRYGHSWRTRRPNGRVERQGLPGPPQVEGKKKSQKKESSVDKMLYK